jgi:hypothetical protein
MSQGLASPPTRAWTSNSSLMMGFPRLLVLSDFDDHRLHRRALSVENA